MSEPAAARSLRSLREGQRAEFAFEIGAEQMRAFAALSGDHNPLHADPAFALARGFEGEVVYGGLLVAQVSRLIGMELPGRFAVWHRLQIDFRKPLYVGQPARLSAEIQHVSEAASALTLKFRIESGGEILASGSAGVRVMDDG